ncbi:hypothetical protein BGZ65_003702 [Modicella reniformis]|uniref:Cation/H+ exchanger transmembrane domain-containing protein n=1 Tax=Modicella reniformis TaxID=1440133 RepID=A0A9P6LUD7_9FUNG|nr:hypothetical protein BGZ65_003702 [Modicella reniformis]
MASPVVLDTAPEHVAYALLGCFIIFFGLVSLFVKEKLFISEAFVSTAFGIIIGPYAIGIFDPMSWKNHDRVTLEFTRIVIAIQVMAAGVSLPRSYMVQERRSLFMMIVPLMVFMWLTSASLIWGIIPNVDFVEAMILAACVTPTDPVLSNSVVKGRFAEKYVPPRIRHLLSAESGINDGMGIPFLYLGLYLLRERTISEAVAKWVYMIWIYQILLSVVIGGLVGAAARKLVKGAKNRNLIDKESFLVFSIALALAVSGCVSIVASDDLLAVFIAGNVFAWDDWFSNEIAEAHIQEVIDMLLNLVCFVYVGASIPFSGFHDLILELSVWRLIVLAIVILIFRRMPFVMAMRRFIPALTTYREAAFAGWFGPIGVGAVYLSKVAATMMEDDNMGDNPYNIERLQRVRSIIFPVVMFLVLSSVLIHGITVPLLHLQYKYTKTWSRKREESSYVVTRLPHINIGDDIVLRSAAGDRSSDMTEVGMGINDGDLEQRIVGYDSPRLNAYDHQRSVSERAFGNSNSCYSKGYLGSSGMLDLTRTSTNNTRTLEDVVQEMNEASRRIRSLDSAAGVSHPLTMVSIHIPEASYPDSKKDSQDIKQVLGDGISIDEIIPSTVLPRSNTGYYSNHSASSDSATSQNGKAIESLKESHQSIQIGSPSGSSDKSSTMFSPARQAPLAGCPR